MVFFAAAHADAGTVADTEALAIVSKHCVMCHAAKPAHESFGRRRKGQSGERDERIMGTPTVSFVFVQMIRSGQTNPPARLLIRNIGLGPATCGSPHGSPCDSGDLAVINIGVSSRR